jgi:hypothetical protein
MAQEVELVVNRLSEMEEIRPTHARRPAFGFLVFGFSFPSFPFSHACRSFFSFFFFVLFYTRREMEEGDQSEIDPWSLLVFSLFLLLCVGANRRFSGPDL